jgi:hypothetical protein
LNSRFLFCKRILSCYEPISDRIAFFRFVQRRREPPFWTHEQLVLKPQYQSSLADTEVDEIDDILGEDVVPIDPAGIDEDELVITNEEVEDIDKDDDKFVSDWQLALDIFRDQQAKGNEKFLRRFRARFGSIQTLVEDVKALEIERTMRRTWGARKNSLTMYYN